MGADFVTAPGCEAAEYIYLSPCWGRGAEFFSEIPQRDQERTFDYS